ncbi:glycosyltransferase [Morganella morganii]|uniref:glycosyltransferase n=1 Tax=Morganella morganii TaxID=582 RepID=UPI002368EEF0|nr:glycosyltransferase [Morganella morganii]
MNTILNNKLISFILVSYNQEKYIEAALLSVLEQDYSNIEIIVSDDGSTDKTKDIIRSHHNDNFTFLDNKENKGLIENLNIAFSYAKGEYVVAMAGDDISLPHRTSTIVKYFDDHPDVYCIYSNTIDIDSDNKEIISSSCGLKYNKRNGKMTVNSHILNDLGVLGCSAAYKQCLVDEPLPLSVPSEDKILTLRALLKGEVGFIHEPLVKYRLGTGISNNTNQRSLSQYIKRVHNIIRTYNGYLKDKSISTQISNDDIANIDKVIKYNEIIISNIPFKFIRLILFKKISIREKIKSFYYLYIKRR